MASNADDDFLPCSNCNLVLTGQRYILHEEKPYCVPCFDKKFTNTCGLCKEKITSDSKDLAYKDRHWHERCFFCSKCRTSLADESFVPKDDQLFCPECYEENFAPRCDGCRQVFKSGSRKYEYKGSVWHEGCFTCVECKQPLGEKSFVPATDDQGAICMTCYEEKHLQKCFKCGKPIQEGGVTYKEKPWHKTCFVCSHCKTQLSGQKFASKDDQAYCADCYSDLFAKRCVKCAKPISGFNGNKFISFEDKSWHSDCFNCVKCSQSLVGKGFLMNDQGVTCPDCGR